MRFVVISLLFNVYWFSAALGPPSFQWLMVAMLLGAILYDRSVMWAMAVLTPVGLIGDSLLLHTQWLAVDTEYVVMPLWLLLLWLGFCSFVWLMRDLILARAFWFMTALGSLGGASSYWAGERLGVLSFPQSLWVTGAVLIGVWLVYSIFLINLMQWLQHQLRARSTATRREP
ncbi:DUF2878 family protein [Salinivibrio kushneri]|uniref:DUF2878 family protein n=1 Tax=Salinivibrio kushneri TaxID=1908198 RepID=UPI0009883D65|nr:DUF2878 family protein [Salinivibrio kushneri]OOE55490.1 hypothetical protein BZG12_03740 [Salinivibrio kushneri]WBA13026.1 DUF2878 family protein [Salinivibrio kushneri]